jgi:hypothetical protein
LDDFPVVKEHAELTQNILLDYPLYSTKEESFGWGVATSAPNCGVPRQIGGHCTTKIITVSSLTEKGQLTTIFDTLTLSTLKTPFSGSTDTEKEQITRNEQVFGQISEKSVNIYFNFKMLIWCMVRSNRFHDMQIMYS